MLLYEILQKYADVYDNESERKLSTTTTKRDELSS